MNYLASSLKYLPTVLSAAKAFESPKRMKSPKPTPPPDEALITASKRRALASQKLRSGRASTVLTDRETLGG